MKNLVQKISGLGAVAVMSALMLVGTSAQAQKIAVVDTQRAIGESKAGKKATEDFKKEQEKKQKEIEKRETEFRKKGEDFRKKQSVLSDEAKAKRGQELQEEFGQHQEYIQKARLDLAKMENDLLQPIAEKMKRVIEKVAKDKGFTLVLQTNPTQQTVVWMSSEHDITTDVISAFDKEK